VRASSQSALHLQTQRAAQLLEARRDDANDIARDIYQNEDDTDDKDDDCGTANFALCGTGDIGDEDQQNADKPPHEWIDVHRQPRCTEPGCTADAAVVVARRSFASSMMHQA